MKVVLIALFVAASFAGKFDVPELKDLDSKNFKHPMTEEFEKLSNSLMNGNWIEAIPAGISLVRNIKTWGMSKSQDLASLFNVTGEKGCPYRKCVKRRLHKACRVGKIFVHLLWHGKQEKARKVLKCLHKILYWATKCKKRRN